jgi:mersacidin/lichenicidin family type 2 lantibiotic
MKKDEIIRAWRDQDYFLSLSDEQRGLLPANPAGMIELSQDALTTVLGASHSTCFVSCHPYSTECCTNNCHTQNCDTCFSGSLCCC